MKRLVGVVMRRRVMQWVVMFMQSVVTAVIVIMNVQVVIMLVRVLVLMHVLMGMKVRVGMHVRCAWAVPVFMLVLVLVAV